MCPFALLAVSAQVDADVAEEHPALLRLVQAGERLVKGDGVDVRPVGVVDVGDLHGEQADGGGVDEVREAVLVQVDAVGAGVELGGRCGPGR